jgi:hypothetical protein
MEELMNNKNNPFSELSQIFIDNQRTFNSKCSNLLERTKIFVEKLNNVKNQIENDPFTTDLNSFLNIEEESRLILVVAKEVEFHRDQILDTVKLLKASNKIKLNK